MENDLINIVLAFVTGITTGGLSCLAVQGGLLASSLANQIENDVQTAAASSGKKKKQAQKSQPNLAPPILAFLAAKLLAYTVLGFILGLLGQMFQLSPAPRAVLQIAIGIFMLGTALRMLNVHPIFRHFAIEPPAFIRRKLRRTAAGTGSSLATPVFLGLLTVLIPCGITQAMMAAALGAGNPLEGAALMFAFTLGTSPVFFGVAYFATRLGAKLEKNFMRFAAVVVLVLAVVTIDSGITLAGSPVSLTRWTSQLFAAPQPSAAASSAQELQVYEPAGLSEAEIPVETMGAGAAPAAPAAEENIVTINVQNTGYNPNSSHAKAGVPVRLRLVSEKVYSCSLAFIIPSLGLQELLKSTGEAWIEIPAQEKGTRMPFSCSMGMFTGEIIFDL